jgi:hypothetical protein
MEGASMAVLDTAAKYRETLLYNRYQAARDNIERFRKEPPFAYVIPQEQRDPPTAATLVEKLLIDGIEVHRAEPSFAANSREYKGAWVILMDQPFSPLVKELFEPQQYPDLRQSPNGPPIRPYDVAGWTLPMQMGVEVAVVSEPLTDSQRASLKRIEQVTYPPGGVQGTGSTYVLSHQPNATFRGRQRDSLERRPGELFQNPRSPRPAARSRAPSSSPAWIASGWRQSRINIRSSAGDCEAAARCRLHQETARGSVPLLDREHRRRMDALDSRKLRVRARDAAQRGHSGRPPARAPGRHHHPGCRPQADHGRLCSRHHLGRVRRRHRRNGRGSIACLRSCRRNFDRLQ